MKTFDTIWEEIHQEMDWGRYPNEEVIRFVARNYYRSDRKKVKILDIGCGTGAITWYLSREGFAAYGVDGSATAIDKANKRLSADQLSAAFSVGDIGELEYGDEAFDAVIDSAVIYANTIPGIQGILKECYRVLKPGGKLFSTGLFEVGMTGHGTGEKIEENTFREMTEGSLAHRGTAHFFTRDEIQKLWTEAGFKDIKVDRVHRTDHNGQVEVQYYIAECVK